MLVVVSLFSGGLTHTQFSVEVRGTFGVAYSTVGARVEEHRGENSFTSKRVATVTDGSRGGGGIKIANLTLFGELESFWGGREAQFRGKARLSYFGQILLFNNKSIFFTCRHTMQKFEDFFWLLQKGPILVDRASFVVGLKCTRTFFNTHTTVPIRIYSMQAKVQLLIFPFGLYDA